MKANPIKWVLGFSIAKFIIHLYTNNLYGLHRDEYLYIDEGKHMDWGYMEVPPLTPFLAWVGDLLGNQVWIYKCIPALAGAAIIYIIGRTIIELGGGKWPIIIAGVALLVSPALLRNATLFQPVIINQLLWLLSAYWVIKIIKTEKNKYYYLLGATMGLAFLNKYSIMFYAAALIIGLLLTPQRHILFKKQTLYALGIAILIALPNIIWQWHYNWPVLTHMAELRETQLVHVKLSSFLSEQLLFHLFSSIVWMAGIYGVFRYIAYYRYRFIVFSCLATVIIIICLSGKAYYTIGAFYILFPFGAITIDKMIDKSWVKYTIVAAIFICSLPFAPLGTAIVPIDQFQSYSDRLSAITGTDDYLYWEDGQKYDIPQDYADMHGWDELPGKVAKVYHALPENQKPKTMIYGYSYGHAGVLNFYKKEYDLPETYSGNGSYMWWADADAQFNQIIVVADEYVEPWRDFNTVTLMDSITHPYARDPGYIYLMTGAKRDPSIYWKERYLEMRAEFGR